MKQRYPGRWRGALHCRTLSVLGLGALLLLGSCGLLKTRDPESPDTGNAANPPAFNAETVISNLAASFASKNVSDYAKVFGDTSTLGRPYVFVPTQEASATYAGFFTHWTVDAEINYFRRAMSNVSSAFTPVVSFVQPPIVTDYHSDSTLYEADYTVYLAPNTYQGRARFALMPNKNTGVWAIYRWEDYGSTQTPQTPTWSDLKGQFSQ